MMCHYLDLGSAPGWLKQIFLAVHPVRNTIQIWVVRYHQYKISALVQKMIVISQGNQW